MTVEIRVGFCVFTDTSVECHTEEAIAANFATLKPRLIESKPLQGSIVISHGDAEIRITDELWAAIVGFCFQSVGDLLNDRVHVYSYFAEYCYVVLIPAGEKLVHVIGDKIKPFDVDRDALLRQLYACGQRYIDFLSKLSEDPDHSATLDVLRKIEVNTMEPP